MDNETARVEILACAAHLFTTHGYHATSVRQIGEALDISQSSLYYHATNKPQILIDLNEQFMSRLVETFEAIEAADASPLDKLRMVIEELLRAVAVNQEVVAVVLHERRSLPPEAAAAIQVQRDHIDAIIDRMLEAGIADGSLREFDVPVARLALTGMTNWAYTWFRSEGDYSADELATQFFDVLLHGLGS
jgi:AcrR family transcriptional regulator